MPAVSYVKDTNICSSANYVVVHRGEEISRPRYEVGEDLDSVSMLAESRKRRKKDLDSFNSDPQVQHTMNEQSRNTSNNNFR